MSTMWLKQSTSVVVQFGPFLDKTNGVDLETTIAAATLDHLTTGIMISKNGGTLAVRNGTPTASAYDAHGMYKITLNTTDTGTLGTLRMVFTDAATHLPVWQDFMVVPANVWDSMFGADALQVDTIQVGGTAQTARDLGASVLLSSGTGAGQISLSSGLVTLAGVTHTGAVIPTVTTLTGHTAQTGDSFARIGAAGAGLTGITGAQLAADQAVNATKFGGAAVTATTSVTFPAASTVATTTGAVGSVTGSVGSLGAQAKLDVNAECDTALDTAIGTPTAGSIIDVLKDLDARLPASGTLSTFQEGAAQTESYAADGATASAVQLLYMIWALLAERSISGTTLTAKKLDGLTGAMTFTLNNGTDPTSQTRAT